MCFYVANVNMWCVTSTWILFIVLGIPFMDLEKQEEITEIHF